jgi:nickel transport protein
VTAPPARSAAPWIAAWILLTPVAAAAHEVLHDVERGRAVAVKAYFADGEALAYAQYEVYSPDDPDIPHQKGRTDRNGYVAFVPDSKGPWRVKVVDNTGHGLDVKVDVAAASVGQTAGAGSRAVSTAGFVLRPLVGLAVIAAVFAALVALRRRKGASP